jgi:hypothetical protein
VERARPSREKACPAALEKQAIRAEKAATCWLVIVDEVAASTSPSPAPPGSPDGAGHRDSGIPRDSAIRSAIDWRRKFVGNLDDVQTDEDILNTWRRCPAQRHQRREAAATLQ